MNKKDIVSRGERLQDLMTYFHINQSELSDKTGIPKGTISKYIANKQEPRQDKLDIIANTFNVNVAWLMGFDCNMFNEIHTETSSRDLSHLKSYARMATPDLTIADLLNKEGLANKLYVDGKNHERINEELVVKYFKMYMGLSHDDRVLITQLIERLANK